MRKLGIYIHIPFCKRKCDYCDFVSFSNKQNLVNKYVETLKKEINKCRISKEEYLVDTIYFGGGTPSYIDSKYIIDILEVIRNRFNVSKDAEITIEVNPGTASEEKLNDYYKSGINRLSIGLQSVDDKLLNIIGRIHSFSDFLKTYSLAEKAGFTNINVDLMIGLPTQNLSDVKIAIEKIVELSPKHISVYSLIVEKGTPIEEKISKKELFLPSETLERKMYWTVKEELEKNGYIHYEISNFAKQGYESKHNTSCWNQEEYIGFGLAAHSYINNTRYSNTEDIEEYMGVGVALLGDPKKTIHEVQDKEDKMKEYMLLALRKIEGVRISEFKKRFVDNPIYLYRKELNKLVTQELIEIEEDNIKLTNKGIDLANLVWEEFV